VRDDPRLDIYAVGALLYEMLAGRPYLDFETESTPAAQVRNIQRIQTEPPRPLHRLNPQVPIWLVRVVERALRKAPRERFGTARELRDALQSEAQLREAPEPLLPTRSAPDHERGYARPEKDPASSYRLPVEHPRDSPGEAARPTIAGVPVWGCALGGLAAVAALILLIGTVIWLQGVIRGDSASSAIVTAPLEPTSPDDSAVLSPTSTTMAQPTDISEPPDTPEPPDTTATDTDQEGFGPSAIWDPYDEDTPGGKEVRDCYSTGTEPLECILAAMADASAPSAALEFVEMTDGEAFMVSFQESGPVDVAAVVYPGRANRNFQYMLVNGTPPIVRADDDYLHDDIRLSLLTNARYLSLLDRFPETALFIWDNQFEGVQRLPPGGQRFIFSYVLRDGCHACEVLAHAFVAFMFDSDGVFREVHVLVLVVPERYESTRRRFQIDPLSLAEQVGSLSYVGQDGNVWILDLDDNRQQSITQLSDGKVISYDWSSDESRLAYVKEREDWSTEIHLLEIGRGEPQLLLAAADYNPFGGMALSPSGEQVAFTADYVDVRLLDAQTKRASTAFQAPGIGVGPGIPTTKRGLNWSPDGQYLAADMYATGSVVLSLTEVPQPIVQFLFPSNQVINPVFAPGDPVIAWVDWSGAQEALVLTNLQGGTTARLLVPDCSLGPNTSLAWAPSGRQIAVTTEDGLCVVDVETGRAANLVPGQGTWNVSWSDDDAWIAFQFFELESDEEMMFVRAAERGIGLVRSDGSEIIDLGVYGSMPSWVSRGFD